MTAARKLGALALAGLAGLAATELLRPSSDAAVREELQRVHSRLEALAGQLLALRQERAACPSPLEVTRAEPRAPAAAAVEAPQAATLEAPQPAPLEAPQPAPRPDPAAEEALQRGRVLVSRALVRGSWTEADALALRPVLAAAGRDGSEELLRRLLPAMNEGLIRVETAGPPF